jgi:uncharacterized surface protein with fasciclin (FAS1) repeats
MPTRLIVLAAMITALVLPAAATAAPSKNLVETAASKPQFSTLVSLVKKAGLVGVLSGKTNYTVFAPTNAAFKKVPKETLDELAKNKSMLKSVLLYHVLPGKVPASKVLKTKSAKTAEGSQVTFEVRGMSAFVNDAKIIKTDVRCSNGIIHAINGVLLPPGS